MNKCIWKGYTHGRTWTIYRLGHDIYYSPDLFYPIVGDAEPVRDIVMQVKYVVKLLNSQKYAGIDEIEFCKTINDEPMTHVVCIWQRERHGCIWTIYQLRSVGYYSPNAISDNVSGPMSGTAVEIANVVKMLNTGRYSGIDEIEFCAEILG